MAKAKTIRILTTQDNYTGKFTAYGKLGTETVYIAANRTIEADAIAHVQKQIDQKAPYLKSYDITEFFR